MRRFLQYCWGLVRRHPIVSSLLFLAYSGVVWIVCEQMPEVLEQGKYLDAQAYLKSIATALENYRNDHSVFPGTLAPDLTTPVPYFQGTFADPYVPEKMLEYYAPSEGGWILISRGLDGVLEINPRVDFDPNKDSPTDGLYQKTYQPSNYYAHIYHNYDPAREGKGDVWRYMPAHLKE